MLCIFVGPPKECLYLRDKGTCMAPLSHILEFCLFNHRRRVITIDGRGKLRELLELEMTRTTRVKVADEGHVFGVPKW